MEWGNVALQVENKIYRYNPELDYPDPFLRRYWDMYNPTSSLVANCKGLVCYSLFPNRHRLTPGNQFDQ